MTDQKRQYRMKRRAEQEARTRLRITESAVELHGTLGPARTTVSAVADHAGVRRSTVYRHFPDEAALLGACSAHWTAENPPPDLMAWGAIEDPEERLAVALSELYAYYGRTEGMMDKLLRDAPVVPVVAAQMGGYREFLAAAVEVLRRGRKARGNASRRLGAALGHALAFRTWQDLSRTQGLDDECAAELMSRFIAVSG
ncbi:MAG: TetR/AcrR family transcriptional regulator [Solirubrobacterales bacterium]